MKCPACSAVLPDDSTECPGCGVNFEKWRARQAAAALRGAVEAPREAEPAPSGFPVLPVILAALLCAAGFGGYRIYQKLSRRSPPAVDGSGAPGEGAGEVPAGTGESGGPDRIKMDGKSLSRYVSEARAVSDKVEEMQKRYEAEQDLEMGTSPSDRDPGKVVPELILLLEGTDQEARLQGVQMLCDVRYAANAKAAIPALEAIVKDPGRDYQGEEVKQFASLALKKIRWCETSSLCKRKWRKP